MDADPLDRLERLFRAARRRPPEQRTAFLDAACAGDPALRRELESLLQADNEAEAEAFLDDLAADWAPGVLAPPVDDDMKNRQVGSYRLLNLIGRGGMGMVYKAYDARLERYVALKFLPSHLSVHEEAQQRFIQEARAASALDHANICTIYDVDETDDGRLFIVMAYYEGQTLKEKIEEGPLSIEQSLDIALQAAAGLRRAHEAGIVHRDLKPANLVVTGRGEVKILDFGIAKLEGIEGMTKAGTRIGTVAYMSPEQTRGERVDHRTDLWSLGVLLCEMLTGQQPFRGDYEQAVIYAILHEDPAPVTSLRPEVPQELERIVGRLLRKDAADRYPNMDRLLGDLKAFGSARGADTPGSKQATLRPQLSRAGYALGGLAAVSLLLTIGFLYIPQAGPERDADIAALSPPPPLHARTTIAVLPFENLGPPEEAYFSAGVTEEITSRLGKISELGVISRNSARHYANTDKTTKQVGEELGVAYVLQGSVRWATRGASAGSVRITPQLIRAADDILLWTDTYDREIDNIFEIQSEIAQEVAERLGMTLLESAREAAETKPTANLEAYQAYLRGRYYAARPDYTAENWRRAVESFQRAVELDPGFALAYAELSNAHTFMFYLGHDRSEERRDEAKRAVERAVELAPESPEVHLALGFYHYRARRAYEQALKEFAIAEQTLPDKAEVMAARAFIFRRQGRWQEALVNLEKAFVLSPRDAQVAEQLARTYAYLRRYAEAINYCDASIALVPDQAFAYYNKTWTYWTWKGTTEEARTALSVMPARIDDGWFHWVWFWQEVYEGQYREALSRLSSIPGEEIRTRLFVLPKALLSAFAYELLDEPLLARSAFDSARVLLETAVETHPEDPRLYSALGMAYAGLGRESEAIRAGQRAVELTPVSQDAYFGPTYVSDLALIYTMVGKHDAALDQIEYLLSIPSMVSVPLLQLDPRWELLRTHPRFRSLLRGHAT